MRFRCWKNGDVFLLDKSFFVNPPEFIFARIEVIDDDGLSRLYINQRMPKNMPQFC